VYPVPRLYVAALGGVSYLRTYAPVSPDLLLTTRRVSPSASLALGKEIGLAPGRFRLDMAGQFEYFSARETSQYGASAPLRVASLRLGLAF